MEKKIVQPTMLVILDGFGYSPETKYNAVYHANTPNIDQWMRSYPHALLAASGTAVGRPQNSIGTSQAGHKTIGAGRVVIEPITMIDDALADNSFYSNPVLVKDFEKLKNSGKTLHIMGLLTTGKVHAELAHLYAFMKAAHDSGIENIVVHPFLDGRDMPPKSAEPLLKELEEKMKKTGAVIGSIHGRFYAMDRDKNYKRTQKCYALLTDPEQPILFSNWQEALDHYYEHGITDEFVPPTKLHKDAAIKPGDGIIFFNFRPDRARQLTHSFVDTTFSEFKTDPLELAFFLTPTSFDPTIKNETMYKPIPAQNTLKEILAEHGKSIFSIAETEKFAHVTYFFSGGKELKLQREKQLLIPSIKAENYIKQPEMSGRQITDALLKSLKTEPSDFYLVNYANADMVGHSGDFDATVKAVSFLDTQLKELYDQVVTKMNGTLYITADHGNAEDMYDEQAQQPKTSHTTNPVPFIMIRQNLEGKNETLPLKSLADIAPFILKEMHLSVPKEMQR